MDDLNFASFGDQVLMEDNDITVEEKEVTDLVFKASHEAKLRELLHKINSIEIKLCSDATKEFIKLLKGHSGGELLRLYVQLTSNFSELVGALKLREGKPGIRYILSLISVILSHPDGKYRPNDKERIDISVILDKFARSLIEEKLEDVYKELASNEAKRQNAALLLMTAIIRRGSGFASEVAKKFDFKLRAFSKLAECKKRYNDKKRKHSTRKAFVGFAMSFLEVGKPGLLRWIVQQREMYSGVLRGLENDDDETVTYILSTLRDRILTEESSVPPSLRSVLFGSVVLEQLVGISGRENRGSSAEVAHNVLLLVCTDPRNGLMPDYNKHPHPLKGNPKRILELMKKLKAAEIDYHRDLILAIVRGRLPFGSAYLMEFPYSLEDHASPTWFSAVSLAANLLSSMLVGNTFGFLDSQPDDPPLFESTGVQNIMNILHSRPLSRSMINKGLLHSDFIVKNGTLRLLLEALKLLNSFFRAINISCNRKQQMQKWKSLKQEIQNEIQSLLPDPQVLLTLLSPLNTYAGTVESGFKRTSDKDTFPLGSTRPKKLKTTFVNEDADIIIGGLSSASDIVLPLSSDNIVDSQIPPSSDSTMEFLNVLSELWGSDMCSVSATTLKDTEIFFQSKILDALRIYLLIMPTALEGSFDFFMNLVSKHSEVPPNLLYSLLSLLVDYIRSSPEGGIAIRTQPLMYKHLQPFLNLLIFSPVDDIKIQSYELAQAAMSSTGAFDGNSHEIFAWLSFLPGYSIGKSSFEIHGVEGLQNLSTVVISFLCDAISTTGNNLFRYWDAVRNHTYSLHELKDISPEFSPLVICVLLKCIRLLSSESGTFSLPEKSMISVYVCTTLKYILQTQVDAKILATLIRSALSEGLQDWCSVDLLCEWRPFKNLLLFAENILHQSCFSLIHEREIPVDSYFTQALAEVRKIVEGGHADDIGGSAMVRAFSSVIICTTSDAVIKNFPTVMTLLWHIRHPLSFLSSIIFLDETFLAKVFKLYPKVFFPGLEKAISMINLQSTKDDAFAQKTMPKADFDDSESAAADAFGLFLRQAPFPVLLPAILCCDSFCLSDFPKLKDLLVAKLSESTINLVIPYLRLILFWFYQIQSSYRIKPLAKLVECAEICYMLVNRMLSQLSRGLLAADLIQRVAETIFYHPAVQASFTCPLHHDDNFIIEDFTDGNFMDNLEAFLSFCQRLVHPIDHHVLDMLIRTFDCLSLLDGQHYVLQDGGVNRQLVKAFKSLTQKLYLELKDKCDLCIKAEDLLSLLQPFYALHALMQFTSPFEQLELAHWIFDRVELHGSTGLKSCRTVLSIGSCIAGDSFKMLSIYLQCPVRRNVPIYSFWDMEEKELGATLIEEIYVKQCKFAAKFKLNFAYSCLLEAITSVYRQKYTKHDYLDPISLVLSRVVMSTPIDILSNCIYETNKIKSKLLFLLVDMSPLHSSVFGYILFGVLNENFHPRITTEATSEMSLSDENFLLLLPAACSYLNSVFNKLEKPYHEQFTKIHAFYSEALLSGFCNWKSFVSRNLFQEDYDFLLPSSIEDLLNLVDASLLGKAMRMLQYHFALGGDLEMDKRLKIFSSLLTCSDTCDELLGCDVDELESYSLGQSLNLIHRVVSKVTFCRMMLFSVGNQILSPPNDKHKKSETVSLGIVSDKVGQSRMQFIQSLVTTWQCIVKKFPPDSDGSKKEKSYHYLQLYRYMELFILKTILELVTEMRDGLIQLRSIPFVEQLMRLSLIYRFEDPETLNVLRSILTLLSEGKFSYLPYLQMLLAHSQFASTIHSVIDLHSSQTGAFFRPMPSILKSAVIFHPNIKKDLQRTDHHLKQLEILKLLRTLVQLKPDQAGYCFAKDNGINLKELHLLLLSSYGATLSEIDLEIYNLMSLIESIDVSISDSLADMDYLWGHAAQKIRKERALDRDTSSNITEAFEEHRRNQFRENLPVDPNVCAATVIHFPYYRTVGIESGILKNMQLAHSLGVENIKQYDPVFILRFSVHVLSMGYIEAVEFAGLGLLAIAFVSTSSPDIEMRKLGYHCIQKFKDALERCQKRKDIMLLRLLVIYMQNGVVEDWQRIPSIIAIFAAESSLILLDPSNDHYTTLSKHLMHSSVVNMKGIPFFHTFFRSNSVNFRAERLWMLRLACAGLNLDYDAHIFMRNSIPKTLLSFYSTTLSDNASKELILQVVKKSVKLHNLARDLVKNHGLIPWLSSILSVYSRMLDENDNKFSSLLLGVTIEVVLDILPSKDILEWLQNDALEQLSELASNLYKLLVGGFKLLKGNAALIDSILQIMISTLKISQKRMIYQPHFTLSFEGLYNIYRACYPCDTRSSSPNAELGLIAILMNTPPVNIFHTNREKLSGFLLWAVSAALKSDSEKISHRSIKSEEALSEEYMVSKLLRWLVAAVILAKLSWKLNDVHTKSSKRLSPTTSLSFLEYVENASGKSNFWCEELLAATIFFLQQLIGLNFSVLSSVVSALHILLCSPSKNPEFLRGYETDVATLQSRVRCPAEANPRWRWSFYQAWRDLEFKMSDLEKMDEYHSCQTLMVIFSNILKKKPLDLQVLSHQDKLISDVFEWERKFLES